MIVITLAVIPLRSGPPSTMHSRVPANHAVSPAVLPAVSPGGSGLAGDVSDDAGDVVRGAVRGQGDQAGAGLGALHAGRSPGGRAGGSGPRLGRDRDRRVIPALVSIWAWSWPARSCSGPAENLYHLRICIAARRRLGPASGAGRLVSIHGFRVTRPGEAAAGARPVSPDSATALANPAKSRCGVDASC